MVTSIGILAQVLRSKDLTSTKLSSLNKFFCAGSVVPEELCDQINQFLPNRLVLLYAMTELAGTITSTFFEHRAGSVGQLVSGTTIKIIDDKGNVCGAGTDGEICVRLQLPILGYYGDASIKTDELVDCDGWLHSADFGHVDEDGFLFVLDRLKEILKYDGYHISPSEIERVILKHPGVISVCVVGIPDVRFTELPAAVVVKSEAVDLTEQEIKDIVKSTWS